MNTSYWIGYDDEESAEQKGSYIANMKLGGVSFWALDQDDVRGLCSGTKSVEIYNFQSKTWTAGPFLPFAISLSQLIPDGINGGCILVAGRAIMNAQTERLTSVMHLSSELREWKILGRHLKIGRDSHVASQAQETKSQTGAQPGPQVAPILKRSTNSFNSSSNNFEVFIYVLREGFLILIELDLYSLMFASLLLYYLISGE